MRYLALQSIVQFSKLNIYLHTLQKRKKSYVKAPSEIIYPRFAALVARASKIP